MKSTRRESPAINLAPDERQLDQHRFYARLHRSKSCILALVFYFYLIFQTELYQPVEANNDAKRLYEDLMTSYNRLVRPVGNSSDVLVLKMGIKLSQLIDVNLRYQMMTTIVWVEQEWTDYKLRWDPDEYGGLTKLHVPADNIWLPDLVLYNNADGQYEVTILTKATLHHDGRVIWKPPAVYKSSCHIDVSYFPFDQQNCILKFGTWTWTGSQIDLRHINQPDANSSNYSDVIEIGIDLSEFLLSVEWDIMAVPATRKEKSYTCCLGAFTDITFNILLRRKTLFYTVNLIIPCIVMSLLSILVFYLPSDSNEKISLSVSIVVSVGVFLLCLIEIIPPTSFTVPLLGEYLLFTLTLVTLSVCATIFVLNISFRTSSTHKMSRLERWFYLEFLPVILFMDKRDNDRKIEEMSSMTLKTCDECHKGGYNSHRHRYQQHATLDRCGASARCANYTMSKTKLTRNDGYCSRQQQLVQPRIMTDAEDEGYHEATWNQLNHQQQSSRNNSSVYPRGREYQCSHNNGFSRSNNFDSYINTNLISNDGPRQIHNDSCRSCNQTRQDIALRRNERSREIANEPQIEIILTNNDGDKFSKKEQITLCGQPTEVANAFLSLDFVAKRMENRENYNNVEEQWRYVATIIDRLFFWIFTIVGTVGTALLIMQAPGLYDTSEPIDIKLSKMGPKIRPQIFP